jgi:hypothetical protein
VRIIASAAELAILLLLKDSASSGLRTVGNNATTSMAKLDAFGKKAQDVGGKMSMFLTAPLVALGATALSAASDTAESLSKVGVVFGNAKGPVEAFAATSATSFGISRQAALEMSGTFGNLFTSIGLTQGAAAGMSVDVVTLGADLASFNNLDTATVLEKLRAGLTGESEPLKSLGINMNDAMVKAKGLSMGLGDVNGVLSESEKVQARYAIIMEQTGTAQGDFARTSDGMANSTRIAKAQFTDMQATLGEQLLPIGIKVVGFVSDLLGAFTNLSPEIRTAILVVAGLLAGIGPVITVVGGLTTAAGILNGVLAANPIGLVVLAIAGLTLGLLYAYNNCEDFRKVVDTVFAFLKDKAIGILDGVSKGFQDVAKFVKGVIDQIKSLIDWIGKIQLPDIGGTLKGLGIPGFAAGGTVPGPVGQPTLAVVHGGEQITPAGQSGGFNWSGNIIIQGNASTADVRAGVLSAARSLGLGVA